MKWIITFLVIVITTIACEKESMNENQQVAAARAEANGIVGTWRMVEYYQDRGDGVGQWLPAGNINEQITFSAEGDFSSTPNSPWSSHGFNKYKLLTTALGLINSNTGYSDTFEYVMESPTQILIYPKCRENCMRRYQLVG